MTVVKNLRSLDHEGMIRFLTKLVNTRNEAWHNLSNGHKLPIEDSPKNPFKYEDFLTAKLTNGSTVEEAIRTMPIENIACVLYNIVDSVDMSWIKLVDQRMGMLETIPKSSIDLMLSWLESESEELYKEGC